MALPYHHAILPLASLADRRTEIHWGLRDFELRFGRPATGAWLPETAVDLPTLRLLADAGVRYTILAPWQAADRGIDTRRPYRVAVGDGLSIVVAFYDGDLSGVASFDPSATADADRFARERVLPRLAGTTFADGTPGLVIVATDGELYGTPALPRPVPAAARLAGARRPRPGVRRRRSRGSARRAARAAVPARPDRGANRLELSSRGRPRGGRVRGRARRSLEGAVARGVRASRRRDRRH
jgi:hypothetical protein